MFFIKVDSLLYILFSETIIATDMNFSGKFRTVNLHACSVHRSILSGMSLCHMRYQMKQALVLTSVIKMEVVVQKLVS